LQSQLNCISDNSRQRPASLSVAQSLFEIHKSLQLQHKEATVTCVNPHIARAINTSRDHL